jgi:hypothetical protein
MRHISASSWAAVPSRAKSEPSSAGIPLSAKILPEQFIHLLDPLALNIACAAIYSLLHLHVFKLNILFNYNQNLLTIVMVVN